ncbi:rhodanese-like domain-containing protein [Rossellomorea sp. GAMAL-10_SWC]
MYFYQKRLIKTLSEEEFRAGYRKAQLIDLRDQEDFKNGHILGARNIPFAQLKTRLKEIRKDQAVYLYDQMGVRPGQAARILRKQGVTELYQLKGGYKLWSGKIKKGL